MQAARVVSRSQLALRQPAAICHFHHAFTSSAACAAKSTISLPGSRNAVKASAEGESPLRGAIAGAVQGIYKATAAFSTTEPGLSPLWTAVKKLNLQGVTSALQAGAGAANEKDVNGDTPLLYIARAGHYKYPPSEIPAALIKAGADMEVKDSKGLTALQVSLIAGWQNIAELLLKANAKTTGVADIKARLTCPDCKRIVAQYNL